MVQWEYLPVIVLGLAMLIGGFWLGQTAKSKAVQIILPWVGVLGLLVIFVGILLVTVPGFFPFDR